MRGYQVCKGIWEANIGEELPYHRGNGEVRASLFRLISPLFFSITARREACDRGPVHPGQCQRDTGTIESYSESRLSA